MKKFEHNFAAEQLRNELSSILCEGKANLLRVTNIKLVTLFWDIGVLLTRHKEENGHSSIDSLPVKDPNSLSHIYGDYFSGSNLDSMARFASEFSSASIPLVASIISWEHICALLTVNDRDKRLAFLNVSVEQKLTPQQLTDRISREEYLQVKKQQRSTRREPREADAFLKTFHTAMREETGGNNLIGNFLFDPAQSCFRQFIDSSNSNGYNNCKSLTDLIQTTKQEINNWLNAEINIVFWRIGMQVNNELRKHTDIEYDPKAVLRVAANGLNKICHCRFSAKHLEEMAAVAEQFPDFNIMRYVSQLIRWEHVICLGSTKDIKAKIFYAGLIVSEGLSVRALRKRIRKQNDGNAINGEDIDRIIYALLQPAIKEGQIKRGNDAFKWKKTFVPAIEAAAGYMSITNVWEDTHFTLLRPRLR